MAKRCDGGSVLITVLVLTALLFLLTASLSYVSRTNARLAGSRVMEAQAFYLAEAGLAAAEARLRVNPELQSVLNGTVATGTYQVTFSGQELAEKRRLLRVTATGHAGVAHKTLTGVFAIEPYPRHPVFDYAVYGGSRVLQLGNVTVEGDVFSNGNVIIRGSSKIAGDVRAAGTIEAEKEDSVEGSILPDTEPIPQPELSLDFYRRLAVQRLPDGAKVNGRTAPPGITFVEGDAFVAGTFPLGSAVVASGTVTVENDTQVEGEGLLFVAAAEGIEVRGNSELHSVLYTAGPVTFSGTVTLYGVAAGDEIVTKGNTRLIYVDPKAKESGLSMPLPGLDVTRVTWYENATTIRSN